MCGIHQKRTKFQKVLRRGVGAAPLYRGAGDTQGGQHKNNGESVAGEGEDKAMDFKRLKFFTSS